MSAIYRGFRRRNFPPRVVIAANAALIPRPSPAHDPEQKTATVLQGTASAPPRPTMNRFDHLIPGWRKEVASPYHAAVERGIRSEIRRLSGHHYLVVARTSRIHFDGEVVTISLDQPFNDLVQANDRARLLLCELRKLSRETFPSWTLLSERQESWPVPSAKPLCSLLPVPTWGDGTGYNSITTHIGVFTIDPLTPLSTSILDALDAPHYIAVTSHFRTVGGEQ